MLVPVFVVVDAAGVLTVLVGATVADVVVVVVIVGLAIGLTWLVEVGVSVDVGLLVAWVDVGTTYETEVAGYLVVVAVGLGSILG